MVIFFVICGRHIYLNRQEFAFLSTLSYPDLFVAGLLIIVNLVIGAFQLGIFLRHLGVSSGLAELVAYATSTTLGNLVLPLRAGTGWLAFCLNRLHGIDFSAFVLIYAGTGLLMALMSLGLALYGLLLLWYSWGFFSPALSLAVACLFSACAYVSIFPPVVFKDKTGILGTISSSAHSWKRLTANRPLLFKASLLFVMTPLFFTGSFYFIYRALGNPLPFSVVLVTFSLGNVANLIPITPGSLGIFDVITIQLPLLFGVDAAKSISATLLFRSLLLVCGLITGIPGILYLAKVVRDASNGQK